MSERQNPNTPNGPGAPENRGGRASLPGGKPKNDSTQTYSVPAAQAPGRGARPASPKASRARDNTLEAAEERYMRQRTKPTKPHVDRNTKRTGPLRVVFRVVGKVAAIILNIILTVLLVGIITGVIVAGAMAI